MSSLKKPDLSIILPSIRPHRLQSVYESIASSTKLDFEIIVVGPYQLPDFFNDKKNVKYVRDFGSPVRAQNIALLLCEGEFLTTHADDALVAPGSIDVHISMLKEMGPDIKNVVIAKFKEGAPGSKDQEKLHHDDYFKIFTGPAASPYFPPNWWLFNVAFMHTRFVEALGGWDCSYEATWPAHTDMAIRAQAVGANVKMSGLAFSIVDHMPDTSGDHAPIHHAQGDHDMPLMNSRYRRPDWPSTVPMQLSLMNWKNSEILWKRRFGEG